MKTGVLLVTLGGPRSAGEITDFIARFTGRELPPPVLRSIIERYKQIGGFSPLCEITTRQTELLNNALNTDPHHEYLCLPAFRYAQPFINESIDLAVNSEIDRIYFLMLSPFYTSVTIGNYIKTAESYLEKISWSKPAGFIHSWHANPLFIQCWVNAVRNEGFDTGAFYVFSAHSLPEKFSTEPYKAQIEETVRSIAETADLKNFALGWQSVPGGASEPWFGPTVEAVMDDAAALGYKRIIQVPVGFTADHIETLYDIDITHRKHAEDKNLEFSRLSSLNTSPQFIHALKNIILKVTGESQ